MLKLTSGYSRLAHFPCKQFHRNRDNHSFLQVGREIAKISYVAGAYDISNDVDETNELQERNVHKIHASKFPNLDMLVVEFEKPFNLRPGLIEPACLPTKEVEIGTKCYASGWGVINATTEILPQKLHAVDLTVVDHQECYERYTKL